MAALRAIGLILTPILFLVAVIQLYVDQRIAAVEANGVLLQIVGERESADPALSWALQSLAPCMSLRKLAIAREPAAEVRREYSGRWEECRSQGRDLSHIEFGPFSVRNRLFCPDAEFAELAVAAFEFLRVYPNQGVRIDRSDFSCISFASSDFRRASVSGGAFVGASFVRASLRHSRWIDVDLTGANFSGADLDGAEFRGLNLQLGEALFQRATLRGAVFADGAMLTGADFFGADVSGADFSGGVGVSRQMLVGACAAAGAPPILPVGLGSAGVALPEC